MPLKLTHIGNHIRLARYRGRITIEDTAGQIGTVSRNIILWEQGGQPHIHALPGILRFLGYDPCPPTPDDPPGAPLLHPPGTRPGLQAEGPIVRG